MRTTSRNANGNTRYTPSPAGEKSEYFAGPGRPPMDGDRVLGSGTGFDSNGNGKGVKRTRSLMQRFRAMVSRQCRFGTDRSEHMLTSVSLSMFSARQPERARQFGCSYAFASSGIACECRESWPSFAMERGYARDHGGQFDADQRATTKRNRREPTDIATRPREGRGRCATSTVVLGTKKAQPEQCRRRTCEPCRAARRVPDHART